MPIAGHPLAEYQVSQLVRAGVERVIVSCGAGQAGLFEAKLSGLGAEIVAVAESEPLGRGGGLRFAAKQREVRLVLGRSGRTLPSEPIAVGDLAPLHPRPREAQAAVPPHR